MIARRMKGKKALPLLDKLQTIDPTVRFEERFDWLYLPKSHERIKLEAQILAALQEDCRLNKDQYTNKKRNCEWQNIYANDENIKGISRILEFDFYLPKFHIAIEFDELQHFTRERQITFQFYPDYGFHFDVSRWIELCSMGRYDQDPPCRDWQRAFRDAIRDLRARENKLPLLRLYSIEFDEDSFTRSETYDKLVCEIENATH